MAEDRQHHQHHPPSYYYDHRHGHSSSRAELIEHFRPSLLRHYRQSQTGAGGGNWNFRFWWTKICDHRRRRPHHFRSSDNKCNWPRILDLTPILCHCRRCHRHCCRHCNPHWRCSSFHWGKLASNWNQCFHCRNKKRCSGSTKSPTHTHTIREWARLMTRRRRRTEMKRCGKCVE